MKPVWSSDIIEDMMGSSRRAKTFARILVSTERSEIGRFEVQCSGSFTLFKIKEMEAYVRVGGRIP